MATTIINNNVINPRNLKQYNAFRGVTDFTNINQFSQYEGGYQALFVLQMPYFMTLLDPTLTESFKHMLEYEFRGMDGLPDISAETMTITDGINEQQLISKVTFDTSATVSMSYFEKTGSLITKFSELYLTGIKDKNSQAKTYHGLIRDNKILDPGPDKEIFTMLYVATDATMLRVERGVLLANCQLTKAETSIYSGNRSDIGSNKELTIEFNCYPIMNNAVDKAAKALLDDMNNARVTYDNNKNNGGLMVSIKDNGSVQTAKLDSTNYKYGIMGTDSNLVNGSTSYHELDVFKNSTVRDINTGDNTDY